MKTTPRTQTLLAVLVATIVTMGASSTANAQTQAPRKWDFQSSHGMANCTFAAFGSAGTSTNVEVVQTAPRSVTVTVEEGSLATLRLQCARTQTWKPELGLFEIGPEVSYSASPGGAGVEVGQDHPDAPVIANYRGPKARTWSVTAGSYGSPAQTVVLTGGGDSITVQLVAGQKPASKQDVKVAEDKADQAIEGSKGGHEKRILSANLSYLHHLDSIDSNDKTQDRRGIAGGFHFYLKPWATPVVKLTLGLEMDDVWRQKPVAAAPNVAPNGFSSYINSKSWTFTPMIGFDVMPVSWLQFYLRGGVGFMVHEDPTAILSQDNQKWVFGQESHSQMAFAYRAQLGFNFVAPVSDKVNLTFGPSVGASGNFTKLPEAAGPEVVCNAPVAQCTRLREGHFTDWPLFLNVGTQFNL